MHVFLKLGSVLQSSKINRHGYLFVLFLLASCVQYNRLSINTYKDGVIQRFSGEKKLSHNLEKKIKRCHKKGLPRFRAAIGRGDTATVEVILHKDPTYASYAPKIDGITPLMWAAFNGHLDLVERFLGLDPRNLNQQDKCGKTALYYAAECGHESIVRYLLEWKQIKIDLAEHETGATPLMIATEFEHESVVKWLIDKGANLALKDQGGNTVLMRAILCNDINKEIKIRICTLLLAKMQASKILDNVLETPNNLGNTLLSTAVVMGNAEKIKCLLDYGANPTVCINGTMPIIAHLISSNTFKENAKNFEWIMRHSAPLIIQINGRKTSLLDYVLRHQNMEALSILMGIHGHHPDLCFNSFALSKHIGFLYVRYYASQDEQETKMLGDVVEKILLSTIASNNKENKNVPELINNASTFLMNNQDRYSFYSSVAGLAKVRGLLQRGVGVDVKDSHGRIALSYATEYGSLVVFNQLITEGADIDATDMQDRSILFYALRGLSRKHEQAIPYQFMIQKLLDKNVNVRALSFDDYLKLVDFVLNKRANQVGMLLPKLMIGYRFFKLLDDPNNFLVLLDRLGKHATLYVNTTDQHGRSVLSYASERRLRTLLQPLLSVGADPNAKDLEGYTPLHYAIKR